MTVDVEAIQGLEPYGGLAAGQVWTLMAFATLNRGQNTSQILGIPILGLVPVMVMPA